MSELLAWLRTVVYGFCLSEELSGTEEYVSVYQDLATQAEVVSRVKLC